MYYYRTKVTNQLLPKLSLFQPDIIFISAGFDGHVDDFYHFLTEDDYYWITQQLCDISNHNNGVVISILEGGYSLSSPIVKPKPVAKSTSSTAAVTQKESFGKFAQKPGDGGLVKGLVKINNNR